MAIRRMGHFGEITDMTLSGFLTEIDKAHGTIMDDRGMADRKACHLMAEWFDETDECVELSLEKYANDPELVAVYKPLREMFQDCKGLALGIDKNLTGSDGQIRMMSPSEARNACANGLLDLKDWLQDQERGIDRRRAQKIQEAKRKQQPTGATP